MREDVRKNIEYALMLRKNDGLTYFEISEKMNRPLGTIKRWLNQYCTEPKNERLLSKIKEGGKKGSLKMVENYLLKRKKIYDETVTNTKEDLKDNLLRDFVNLYIGEGSKRSNTEISLVNSDPKIVFLSLVVMKKFFLNKNKKINLHIKYYIHNNNEKELLEYWRNLLNNDESIIFKTYVQPTTKPIGHNNSNKFGLVAVRIFDSYAREKLNAYMDYIKAEWVKNFEESFNTIVDINVKEIKALVD